jgi:hypothetical protein
MFFDHDRRDSPETLFQSGLDGKNGKCAELWIGHPKAFQSSL